jgi:APA family basic amino acid/polyamine antiporter
LALKRDLSYFDLTNIVVGAIVGSDIYIASALTAGLVGPFSIVIWIVAGVLATILAMIFAYSSYYVPKVGGSFAFVSTAFNNFYGFLAGWSMWIAEVLSLPVFAITFTNYLQYFVQLNLPEQLIIRGGFLFGLTAINIVGVKAAGRLNDVLTIAKLFPLLLIVIVGVSSLFYNPGFVSNYTPFAPFGLGNFGTALVLIFWAYAGFELGSLPAAEVKNPKVTIPKAIITGMGIVTFFYLTTNFVIFGTVSSPRLAQTVVPLVLAGSALLGAAGAAIVSAGALISVSGSDESAILGTARLAYAMSLDGLFPRTFAKVHPKFKTPYSALIVQGIIAFVFSTFSGLTTLISFAVFNLSFSFLLVAISFSRLRKRGEKGLHGQRFLPWLGVGICLYLLYSTTLLDKIAGTALILAGIPLYIYFSPKTSVDDLKAFFTSEDALMARSLDKKNRFLANLVRMVAKIYRKIRGENSG